MLLVKTNSDTILHYLTVEFSNYFSREESQAFAYYLPLESDNFEKLQFPADGKMVWAKKHGSVTYKNGKYYGLYHEGLVKGMYNTKNNMVINLIRDPSRYFNICIGVIDYLFSKALLQDEIFRVHAACVSKDNNTLLICGPEGTGKTTFLMKLLLNGYNFVADDATYLQFQNDKLFCYPFPRTIKIPYEDIEKFPHLYNNLKYLTLYTSHGIHKAVIKPEDNAFPIESQITPITQIILPVITQAQHSTLEELHKKFAFDRLICSFRGDGLLNIDHLPENSIVTKQKELCQRALSSIPIKILNIGKDLKELNLEQLLL